MPAKVPYIQLTCKTCGTAFYVQPSRAKRRPGQNTFCSKKCTYEGRDLKGIFKPGHVDLVPASSRGHTEESKKKISVAGRAKGIRGSAVWNWKGGISKGYKTGYYSSQYKDWRNAVFARANFRCERCSAAGYLTAHHIKSFAKYPELRFDLDNGQCLCEPCHAAVDNYYARMNKKRIKNRVQS